MKKFSLVAILLAVGMLVVYVAQEHQKEVEDRKLDYYLVLCGEAGSENETQHVAIQKDGKKYLVRGEYREFPGCRVEKHLGKANKIQKIPN